MCFQEKVIRSKGLKVSLISDKQCFNTSLLCAAVCDSLHPKIESNKMDFFSCWTNQVPARAELGGESRTSHTKPCRSDNRLWMFLFLFFFYLFVCLCAFGWTSTVSPLSWHHECPHTTRTTTTRCFWKPAHRLHSCSLSVPALMLTRAAVCTSGRRKSRCQPQKKKKKKTTASWRRRRASSCLLQGGGCEGRP